MLLTLIIILILIGAAVIGSIYSNFMVFYSNFSESENYHKAYYASISALERGELVTKQRSPGYVGSGGFIMGIGQGSQENSDGGSDKNLTGFSYLGDNNDVSSVFRTINSRTTRIPSTGNGDVEQLLAYKNTPNDPENSNNYNMMGYENSEVFLLYYDNSQGNPYEFISSQITNSKPASVKGEIRLPKLLSGFGYLDTSKTLVGRNSDLPKDDAIVDRQIRGTRIDEPFTIYSTQTTTGNKVYYSKDSIFRESDINNPLGFNFSTHRNPITEADEPTHTNNIDKMKVISEYAYDIEGLNFKNIFESPNTENISLRFSLLNLLKATKNGTTRLYPFLEYYVDFGGQEVSDKYYTINAEGNFKDFQVNTIIQKPTVKETVLGNFTSIF